MLEHHISPQANVIRATGNVPAALEMPASLVWLEETDARIFTPATWKYGGMTRVRFASPKGIVVGVHRLINKSFDCTVAVQDEFHIIGEGNSTLFRYAFNAEGRLVNYDQPPKVPPRIPLPITHVQGLVNQAGSLAEAVNETRGLEAQLVSDGQQWIDVESQLPVTLPIPLMLGQLVVESPSTEQSA